METFLIKEEFLEDHLDSIRLSVLGCFPISIISQVCSMYLSYFDIRPLM